jgi:hypothetical protein
MWKFRDGQIVERIGHPARYKVIGYNGLNGVIVIEEGLKDNHFNREVYRENELRKVKKPFWFFRKTD